MKIKLNELHTASWKYINIPEVNLYEGKLITYRESKKYGYRFTLIRHNDNYYLTQALYSPILNKEEISVYQIKSINDAKACINVMIDFIIGMRQKKELDA